MNDLTMDRAFPGVNCSGTLPLGNYDIGIAIDWVHPTPWQVAAETEPNDPELRAIRRGMLYLEELKRLAPEARKRVEAYLEGRFPVPEE